MVAIEGIKLLQGISVVVFLAITIVVSLSICKKYFKNKEYEYILVGIAWIGLASAWIPDAICFFINIINPSINPWYVAPEWYLIVGNGITPIFVLFWTFALRKLVYPEKGNLLIIGVFLISLIYEINFLVYLFLDPNSLAIFSAVTFTIEFELLILAYIIFILVFFTITGIHFSLLSSKTGKPELKLRAKLLIIAILLFAVGALLDSVIPPFLPLEVYIIMAKSILITSSILYYIGFVLPEWAKKRLIK